MHSEEWPIDYGIKPLCILYDYRSKPDLSISESHHHIVELIERISLQCRLDLAFRSEFQDVDKVRRVEMVQLLRRIGLSPQ